MIRIDQQSPSRRMSRCVARSLTASETVSGGRQPVADRAAIGRRPRSRREHCGPRLPRTRTRRTRPDRGRAGTFVHTSDLAKAQLETAARSYARVIHATGLTVDEAIQLLRTAINPATATI